MNISLRWLKDLAPELGATPEEIAERLTHRGFPVEGREDLAAGLGEIQVARVTGVRPHPDADRLTLCQVDSGGETLQVVCGAPNVREGGWYPFAPVGSTLPGGMKIRKAKLRGEPSHGMLCSEKELGLGSGADGLMTLEGDFAAGDPLVEALGLSDIRLDVEVTSNRPDLLSHQGMAREVLREGDGEVRLPGLPGDATPEGSVMEWREGEAAVEGPHLSIRIEDPDRCPRYLGIVIRGVEVGPSPAWLQARLRAVGARPVNNVVDATNYILHEVGQPLHAFDLDRIGGGAVVVRKAREGEELRTLDGVDRGLTPEMLAICDAERPMAVAGVLGGAESEVTEETRDILLECALFTPGPIRATRKALALSTDASYRFERGVDPEGLRAAAERCARLIVAVAGGEVEAPLLDATARPHTPVRVTLRPARVEAVLGVHFTEETIRELLEPLGFTFDGRDGEALSVGVPGWRSWDVTREVDLVEEIARTWGFDHFPDTLNPYRPGTVPDDPRFALEDELRSRLSAWGLLEAQTPAFAPEGEGEVEVSNPVSAEERYLRRSLVPALLRRVEYNLARRNRDIRLYEIGTVFTAGEKGALPGEATRLAVVLHGRRLPEHWSTDDSAVDLWEVKGLLESLGASILSGGGQVVPHEDEESDLYLPGTTVALHEAGGEVVGTAGAVHPDRVDLPPWAGTVWALDLALPEAPAQVEDFRVRPLPTHPGTERDLALVISDDRTVEEVLGLVRERGGEILAEASIFDLYRGRGIPEGHRSVAVRLHFRAEDRTLTDAEVDGWVDAVAGALKEEMGVGIRGR